VTEDQLENKTPFPLLGLWHGFWARSRWRSAARPQARILFLIDGQPFLGEEIVNAGRALERLDAREALVFLGGSRREPGGSEPHRVVAQIGRHAGAALGRGDERPHAMRPCISGVPAAAASLVRERRDLAV
jgi:hypothetical protein